MSTISSSDEPSRADRATEQANATRRSAEDDALNAPRDSQANATACDRRSPHDHRAHTCFGGWLYEFGDNGPRPIRRCDSCALRKFAGQTGRPECTWTSWEDVPELIARVASLRAWQGRSWSALLHASPASPNFGSGKSHASIATGAQWITDGRDAQYFCAADLVHLHRQAMFHAAVRLPAFEDFAGLAILDDLGSETRTDWTRDLVDRILDRRYRRNLPTMITTNLDLAAIEERYPRLRSRFCEGLQLAWSAPDFRRRKEQSE